MKEEDKRVVMYIGICAIVLLAFGSLAKATTVHEERYVTYYEYDAVWVTISVLIAFSLVAWLAFCNHWMNGRA